MLIHIHHLIIVMEAHERRNIGNGHWVVRKFPRKKIWEQEESRERVEGRKDEINTYLVHMCTTLRKLFRVMEIPFPLPSHPLTPSNFLDGTEAIKNCHQGKIPSNTTHL